MLFSRHCQCRSPMIRCDHRGCRCQLCGELERLSPMLQKALDETRQKIVEAARPSQSFRVRVRAKLDRSLADAHSKSDPHPEPVKEG